LRDEGSLLRQNLSPRGSSFFNKWVIRHLVFARWWLRGEKGIYRSQLPPQGLPRIAHMEIRNSNAGAGAKNAVPLAYRISRRANETLRCCVRRGGLILTGKSVIAKCQDARCPCFHAFRGAPSPFAFNLRLVYLVIHGADSRGNTVPC
jgi:hypothetical protein